MGQSSRKIEMLRTELAVRKVQIAKLEMDAKYRAFAIKSQTCKHETVQQAHGAECFICGVLDCPTGCELHHHHDGCAECQ